MLYGIAAAISALLALLLAAVLAALLRRCAGTDRPRARPVPPLGGLTVVLATGAVAVAGDRAAGIRLGPAGDLLVAAAAVAVLGLVADVWRLRTRFLVAGTAVAAACVVPYGRLGPGAGLSAVAWIVFVAVAFKGLDRADGPAGTVGVVTACGVGVCAAAGAVDGLVVLLSVLAAALAGFLLKAGPRPARIGLGACGSLFTGFLLASAAVLTRGGYGATSSAGVLFALTAVVSTDAVCVLLSRWLAGRPLPRGGPDHLAHRLRRLGLTPQGATVVLGAGAFSGALVGVLVHVGWIGGTAVLGVAAVALVVVLALLRVPVYGVRRQPDASVRSPRRAVESSQVSGHLRVRNG